MQAEITKAQQAAQNILDLDAKRSEANNKTMHPFLRNHGMGALIAQGRPAITPTPAEPSPPAATVKKNDATQPEPKAKTTTLKVECDGGLYFDSENGVLAYLKNIRLTEPRFKLTCSDELKVFLTQEPAKPADKEDKKKESSMPSFGELKRIVASGKVKVTQKDENGNTFIASANTASYNAKTGEMILKGGLPRLQQSATQYLQAREPGAWIRIHKNGKLITSKSKWMMQTSTKKNTP